MTLVGCALTLLLLLGTCMAQVEMREPPPRRSKFSKFYISADDVDYNMKSGLGGKIGFPCRNTTAGPSQGTLVAGQDLKVFFDGTATRQGGDCQFAVSYDNGTNFAVIWDKLGNCFLDTVNGGYEVPVPDRLPAAKDAVFAWTWIPTGGSRSYYMNCADVRIENYGKQEAYTGKELLVVNVPGKPRLAPLHSDGNDTLSSLLDGRQLITVGTPAQSSAKENGADDTSSQEADQDVDPENEDGDSTSEEGGDKADGGTVVMYVSESTTTTTDVVVVSQFITDDDTDTNALYTFGNGIQTRGQLSTTLGPYVKPLFGSNVGLTIVPDSTSDSSDFGALSFTGDWAASPTGSAKWLGGPSLDFIPPSLSPPHTTPPTSSSIDLLLTGSPTASKNGADLEYPAGTPLFSSSQAVVSLGSVESDFVDSSLGATGMSLHGIQTIQATNRPSLKSVMDNLGSAKQHAATKLSTVTRDGKLALQVVVSVENTVHPTAST